MTTDVGIRQASTAASDLGEMPVWNLGDLYPSPTSAEFQRDLDKAAADAKHMAETYKGKLAGLGRDGPALAGAVKAYEALRMGPSTSWDVRVLFEMPASQSRRLPRRTCRSLEDRSAEPLANRQAVRLMLRRGG